MAILDKTLGDVADGIVAILSKIWGAVVALPSWFWRRRRPPTPGVLGPPQVVEVLMALHYTITLPAPGAADVAVREINMQVDQDPAAITPLAKDAMTFEFDVKRDRVVSLFLIDIDAAGNRSLPSPTLTFTAIDTIPPPPPGTLTISNVVQTD